MRKHRGLAPEDGTFFDPERVSVLKRAVSDLTWLLRHGYSQKAASQLVGNRYQLTKRERSAMLHAAWSREYRPPPLPAEDIKGKRLCIDGFNILITLETAIGGGILIRGVDGCYRDIANVHGSYSFRAETQKAVEYAAEAVKELGVEEAVWYFDRPVSNSGRIARLVNDTAKKTAAPMYAETVDEADRRLKNCPGIVVTADAEILDSGVEWFDLTGWIIEHKLTASPVVIDLI